MKALKHDLQEEPCDEVHRERFDQPVYDECDDETLGPLPCIHDALEINLQHHGKDHQPDENCYRNRYVGILQGAEKLWYSGKQHSQSNTESYTQSYP